MDTSTYRSPALKNFNYALELNPHHKLSLFNSALLMQESGEPRFRPEANRRCLTYIQEEPDDANGYFNLGMLAMDADENATAEHWMREATRRVLFNPALLHSQSRQEVDALPVLDELLHHHPEHVNGLILMGDRHPDEPQEGHPGCQDLLPENPPYGHPPTCKGEHTTLRVVYFEERDLPRAECCLEETLGLVPQRGVRAPPPGHRAQQGGGPMSAAGQPLSPASAEGAATLAKAEENKLGKEEEGSGATDSDRVGEGAGNKKNARKSSSAKSFRGVVDHWISLCVTHSVRSQVLLCLKKE
ncbi:unnamed protein product [Oncorhynchus mykiss]|uniref:Uncharacterized protein n=1 Tax=Oncorhynchus mykiss TaxID=8022 RepID=A0A060WI09_ONCMY|nr:unnamed protein product [Oncorhynchus mykiss]